MVSACVADRNVPRYLIASPFILRNKALAMYNQPKYTPRDFHQARRGMPRIGVLNAHLYPAPEADQTPLEIGVWVWQMTGERWSGRTDDKSDYAYARKKWVRFQTVTQRIGDRYEFHPSVYTRNSSRLATLRARLDRANESGDVDAMTKLTAALERCRGDVLQDVEDFACVFDEDKKRCVDKYRERQNNFNTTHVCGSCGVRNPYDPGKTIVLTDLAEELEQNGRLKPNEFNLRGCHACGEFKRVVEFTKGGGSRDCCRRCKDLNATTSEANRPSMPSEDCVKKTDFGWLALDRKAIERRADRWAEEREFDVRDRRGRHKVYPAMFETVHKCGRYLFHVEPEAVVTKDGKQTIRLCDKCHTSNKAPVHCNKTADFGRNRFEVDGEIMDFSDVSTLERLVSALQIEVPSIIIETAGRRLVSTQDDKRG